KLAGDAGWGGALAETALHKPGRSAVIVFRPGMDLLPLIVEAVALLPPQKRWEVTFSTFFTQLAPGMECQWRCVLEGSAERRGAVRPPGALWIARGNPLGAPQGSELVPAARSGTAPRWTDGPNVPLPDKAAVIRVGPMSRPEPTVVVHPTQ